MHRTHPDAIDTRIVFRIYAIIAWIGGFCLAAWGVVWLGTDLPGLPYGLAIPLRLAGAAVMCGGCMAWALVKSDDPGTRHRALLWFACGHAIVLLMIFIQSSGPWENPGPAVQILVAALMTTIGVFLYFWQTGDGYRPGGWSLFTSILSRRDARPSADDLRSEYEQRIRETAGQEERNRLARDLHDSIKQQVFVIQTAAATAEARFSTDRTGTAQAIAQIRSAAREAMVELEAMLDQLRAAPLENTGLVEALKKQSEALGFRTGATVAFAPGPLPPNDALPPGAQQAVFRIAQEALANVGRHARASKVGVSIGSTDDGNLRLTIEDDGAGFDPAEAPCGMGLSNMRERATEVGGAIAFDSRPGGTTVRLVIPASAQAADWSDYRRRVVSWFIGVTLIGAAVIFEAYHNREIVVGLVPPLLIGIVVLARSWIAYRRARKRRHASPWEEYVSHS